MEQVRFEHHVFRRLQAIPVFFGYLLVFLIGTGVRWGEAAGLSVKHLHLDPPPGDLRWLTRPPCGGPR